MLWKYEMYVESLFKRLDSPQPEQSFVKTINSLFCIEIQKLMDWLWPYLLLLKRTKDQSKYQIFMTDGKDKSMTIYFIWSVNKHYYCIKQCSLSCSKDSDQNISEIGWLLDTGYKLTLRLHSLDFSWQYGIRFYYFHL